MSRIIFVSLKAGFAHFLAVAIAGYAAGGCQLSGNLLFSVVDIQDRTSVSALGFMPHRGAIITTYVFMHVHIVIAFSTITQPAFYMAERFIFSMHKTVADDVSPASKRMFSKRGLAISKLESNYRYSVLSASSIKLMVEQH